jgi:hypothetical protein
MSQTRLLQALQRGLGDGPGSVADVSVMSAILADPGAHARGGNDMLRAIRQRAESTHSDNVAVVAKQLKSELADKVTLTHVLGKGSSGTVYKGNWRGLEVAVKTLLFPVSQMGQAVADKPRAVMEAATCLSLNHRNVVATYRWVLGATLTGPEWLGARFPARPAASCTLAGAVALPVQGVRMPACGNGSRACHGCTSMSQPAEVLYIYVGRGIYSYMAPHNRNYVYR